MSHLRNHALLFCSCLAFACGDDEPADTDDESSSGTAESDSSASADDSVTNPTGPDDGSTTNVDSTGDDRGSTDTSATDPSSSSSADASSSSADSSSSGGADESSSSDEASSSSEDDGSSSGGPLECAADEILCGETCIDPMTSEAFCGAVDDCIDGNAGVICMAGAELCLAGACEACLAPEPGMQVFEYTGVIDTFEVPACVGTITIDASGAQGGGLDALGGGGLGAQIIGDFDVTPGASLTVVVGQRGQLQMGGNDQNSSGGGGGSFVYEGDTLLAAAGGGGGRCNYDLAAPLHLEAAGSAEEDGNPDSSYAYLGGVAGAGGSAGYFGMQPDAGGGAGWLSDGGSEFGGHNASGDWAGGDPFCGGGGGCGGYGGFGGGGGGGDFFGGGGGGGGYSGGGGGTDPGHGGGGGSFNGGNAPTNASGVRDGDGVIVITW